MKISKLFKKKDTIDYDSINLQTDLPQWLDQVLCQKVSQAVKGFCFNLYDDGDNRWSLEIVGTESFDKDEPDWPCEEITDLGTRKNPFIWEDENTWNEVLEKTTLVINLYLKENELAKVLKEKDGIGIGFVDGDVKVIYINS